MTDVMHHRGPDGRGTWIDGEGLVGLGHRRLAILDLSEAGSQPMRTVDGSVVVTFNGEIYNFPDLRAELAARGYRFRSRTDTEVLLYLYQEYRDAMVERLSGDFAFAIWDDFRKRLLLVRDRLGVKPVYYARIGEHFVFGSEVKALLKYPNLAAEIDEESLYHYLTYLVVPPPKTLNKGIFKLPAGGALSLELGCEDFRIRTWRYWRPLPGQIELRHDDLDQQFEELFDQSVQKRLMSDVPVGVLFSGGVDSTLNAATFQRKVAPRSVRTFNVGVQGTRTFHDESDFAAEMAVRIGAEHHVVQITETDLLDSIHLIVRQQDEPLADPVCVPLYFVTKLARETGTTVLHAGEGADETFCGYDNYRRFLRHYGRLWRPLSWFPPTMSWLAWQVLRRSDSPRGKRVADVFARRYHRQRLFLSSAIAYYETEKAAILSADFRTRCGDLDSFSAVEPLYRTVEQHCPQASFLQKLTFIELQLRLPELLLMRVDKMSMLNSIEVRVPFLDERLVEFALSIPDSFKLRDGISKEPVKRLAARYVPRDTIYRPKTGFGAPIQEWFRTGLGSQLRSELRTDSSGIAQFFDTRELLRRLDRGPRTVNEAFQLWVIYNFAQWKKSQSAARARLVAA